MAKQTLIISDFSGGIVTDLEDRDIPDNASPQSINVGFFDK